MARWIAGLIATLVLFAAGCGGGGDGDVAGDLAERKATIEDACSILRGRGEGAERQLTPREREVQRGREQRAVEEAIALAEEHHPRVVEIEGMELDMGDYLDEVLRMMNAGDCNLALVFDLAEARDELWRLSGE